MKYFVATCSLSMMVMLCYQTSSAQVPRTLSYQGVLTDSLGTPKPDGTYSLTFRLYDTESGGTALWAEAKSLQVERGLFSTLLGDQVAFGSSLKFDEPYWLGVQVASQPELSPRIPLSAVGYSFNSLKADTALYARESPVPSHVDSARIAGTIKDGAVSSAKIQDGTIQFADLAQNGAASGEVIKWNGSAWSAEPDVSGSGGGGGWTDAGKTVVLTTPSDTVALNTTMRLGKLNVNGDIGVNLTSSLYFGGPMTRISGLTGGDLRFIAEDLSALTTEDITFGHYGDETWIGFNNSSKRVGVGTLDPADRLHVVNDDATSCWMRVETSHPSQWGQAGLRIKTPENLWQLGMESYSSTRMSDGGLGLYSLDRGMYAMTWLPNGCVGIRTTKPLMALDVEGSILVRDTVYARTIDSKLLRASELPDEPGVAASRTLLYPNELGDWTPIAQATIEVPGPGYVVAIFSVTLSVNHSAGDRAEAFIGISPFPDRCSHSIWWSLNIPIITTMTYREAISTNEVFRVAGKGLYTFYGMGARSAAARDEIDAERPALVLMYFPTAYGGVASTLVQGAAGNTPASLPDAQERDLDPNSQALQPGNGFDSLQSEVRALKLELQALRDEITSRGK